MATSGLQDVSLFLDAISEKILAKKIEYEGQSINDPAVLQDVRLYRYSKVNEVLFDRSSDILSTPNFPLYCTILPHESTISNQLGIFLQRYLLISSSSLLVMSHLRFWNVRGFVAVGGKSLCSRQRCGQLSRYTIAPVQK